MRIGATQLQGTIGHTEPCRGALQVPSSSRPGEGRFAAGSLQSARAEVYFASFGDDLTVKRGLNVGTTVAPPKDVGDSPPAINSLTIGGCYA
jgi:hypothetical protein